MEYGHPLHTFDADLLAGGTIVVRRAAEGERFRTLDGQERELTSSDLTIRDAEKAVALAGIMGGENSEIKDETTNILLESAYFNPSAIRKTAKRLGIHTESSHRFERGADIEIVTRALDRAASLIAELSGGEVAQGIIDVYPREVPPRTISFRLTRCNQLLGWEYSLAEVEQIFQSLEFTVSKRDDGLLQVTVPTFRVDLEREIDLIEEVARLHGYDAIPVSMPKARVFSDRPSRHQRLERRLKDGMVGLGFNEVINFSFMAPDVLDRINLGEDDGRRKVVKLRNPLVEEQSVMRTTLLPGLLETAARNMNYRILDQRLFELRRVYLSVAGQELPHEPLHLAALVSGGRYPEGWDRHKQSVDFYDVKGIMEAILAQMGVANVSYTSSGVDRYFHPGKACTVYAGHQLIGSFGEVHPDVQDAFGLAQSVYYLELNIETLVAVSTESLQVVPPSRFPESVRDVALLVADEVPAAEVLGCITNLKIAEIECADIFDLYKGPNIPSGSKSIAVRVRYRSHEKTLTDDEVSAIHQRVIDTLTRKLAATIR